MQVINKLNNNFAICIDGEGKELIAVGKGIGFPKTPYEVEDLNLITRTFYDIDPKYIELFKDIPEKVVHFTAKLVEIAKNELGYEMNPNLVVTMSDHIHFSIQRAQKNIDVQMPLIYEVEQTFPAEARIGKYAVKQIERRFNVRLDPNEASGIAMNFVNARYDTRLKTDVADQLKKQYQEILEDTISIVEDEIGIVIDRDSFNFARYSSHLMYLLDRIAGNKMLYSDNGIMYQSMKDEFPGIAACVELLERYFKRKCGIILSKEEKLCLILHINRICTREGL